MSNIKLVVVPAWLDLFMKELGITNDDLAKYEKLSGILSPRDLLIYKQLNFRNDEVFMRLLGDQDKVNQLGYDFDPGIPVPTLAENASCANIDLDTLIYGATTFRDKDQQLFAEVYMSDSEVLCIRLIPQSRASQELKDSSKTLAERMFEAMFDRVGLVEAVKYRAFKQYVKEIPFNSVFY
ncbi:hypothetical protein D3C76_25180 [compost metagenome]